MVLSVLLAFVAGGVVILASGENPFEVYKAMLDGAFGSRTGVAETLVKTIPLLLTGLGVAVAFRMQLWNIGAEGQLYFGAMGATWIALFVLPDAPSGVLIPAMVVAGLAGGALWGAVPGVLRGFFGVNEIITSLMLNYVAIIYADYLVHGAWRNPVGFGFPGTEQFPRDAWLPRWDTTRVHLGLIFGLVAALAVWIILRHTRWGYEIAVTGESEHVARYAGMATKRNIVLVMAMSGALAGLAGMSEVAGVAHQLQPSLSPGYGYTAIIVAWLGRLNPAGVILVAFLLAGVLVGGDQLQMSMGLSSAVGPMLQGTILFFIIGGEMLARYRIVWRRPATSAAPAAQGQG
jgi:simple sugar transport system permease protein